MATKKKSSTQITAVDRKTKTITVQTPAPQAPGPDSNLHDSAGNKKTEPGPIGPRGKNAPLETLSEEHKRKLAEEQEAKGRVGMSSTDTVDSFGNAQHAYATEAQGHDRHGVRRADKVDTNKVLETAPAQVGPRGTNAPQDSHHGKKPKPHEPAQQRGW